MESRWRRDRLRELEALCHRRAPALLDALKRDMGKPATEAYTAEIAPVLAQIRLARKKLRVWMRRRGERLPLIGAPSRGGWSPRPYGAAVIIGPWNYPAGLLLTPLVSALAAGNCALLKPSDHAPHTARALARAVADHFDPAHVACVAGDSAAGARLIESGPDMVFFTGGAPAGASILQSCARRLIPAVAELGGCNPVMVDGSVDAGVAARRIVWAKFFNAGQTCLAPNACYVTPDARPRLIAAMREAIRRFYGADPCRCDSYARIVNDYHYRRLQRLLQAQSHVIAGGECVRSERCIAPTLIDIDADGGSLLDQEIFGPLLPIRTAGSIADAVRDASSRPTPLAMYLFSRDRAARRLAHMRARCGVLVINGVMDAATATRLPFGGVGTSGMGRYHGKAGFDAFSWSRAVIERRLWPELGFVYPPYRTPPRLIRAAMRVLLRS